MRNLLLLGILLLVIGKSWAQTKVTESDPKAVAILDEVSKKFKDLDGIRAEFSLTIEIPEEEFTETQEGSADIKDNQFKLKLGNQLIMSDNQTMWTYLEDVNEVQIDYFDVEEFSISPDQLFTLYSTDFVCFYTGTERLDNVEYAVIELTPKDKSKPYFKIRMWVDTQSNTVKQSLVFERTGNRYTYLIKQLNEQPNFGETHFEFNPANYPDIVITDLR